MNLTSKEKANIRRYAQNIKATFQIGAKEIHERNIEAIKESFNNKEVIKVKVNREDKSDKTITKIMADRLSRESNSEIAGVIGTTIILYKKNKNIEEHVL